MLEFNRQDYVIIIIIMVTIVHCFLVLFTFIKYLFGDVVILKVWTPHTIRGALGITTKTWGECSDRSLKLCSRVKKGRVAVL
jgi:hypothetical protein